ncbi:hypothetical protein QLX67_11485, partial [Balneolaceae bacterium ANBcel3]|nr:hypothetical protein [Balneolaceae bacterium ANBcel3]
EAVRIWTNVIEQHAANPHSYRMVAEMMNERRLFRDAIEIYKKAQVNLREPQLFAFNIADNYLALADYEPALEIYFDQMIINEDHVSRLQRQFLNQDERQLYDTGIVLLEERITSVSPGSREDAIYRDMLVWLNMERGLYQRAFAAARSLAERTDYQHHSLFRTARQLRMRQQFELAEQAFRIYIDREQHVLRPRSFEELSRTYMDWATWVKDQNLDFGGLSDSLYRQAFHAVGQLTREYPAYERLLQTLSLQAELALDYLKDPVEAEYYLERMRNATQSDEDLALAYYVEGRIYMFESDFSLARVSLTRSNRLAERDQTAEKSRFYLGLSDFYQGDFTFSRLQLRSLERFNHSNFANNALQLRYLIQQGYVNGEVHPALQRYSRARFYFDTGNHSDAAIALLPVLSEQPGTPLYEESLLLLIRSIRACHPETAYRLIHQITQQPSLLGTIGETLLWERARLAELVFTIQQSTGTNSLLLPEALGMALDEKGIITVFSEGSIAQISFDEVMVRYEDLLIRFPEGYYSEMARTRIRTLNRSVPGT